MAETKQRNIVLKAIKAKIPNHELPSVVSSDGYGMNYPDLCVNTDQVPALDGFKAGEKIRFMVEGQVRRRTVRENLHGEEKKPVKCEDFTIRITKIGLDKAK